MDLQQRLEKKIIECLKYIDQYEPKRKDNSDNSQYNLSNSSLQLPYGKRYQKHILNKFKFYFLEYLTMITHNNNKIKQKKISLSRITELYLNNSGRGKNIFCLNYIKLLCSKEQFLNEIIINNQEDKTLNSSLLLNIFQGIKSVDNYNNLNQFVLEQIFGLLKNTSKINVIISLLNIIKEIIYYKNKDSVFILHMKSNYNILTEFYNILFELKYSNTTVKNLIRDILLNEHVLTNDDVLSMFEIIKSSEKNVLNFNSKMLTNLCESSSSFQQFQNKCSCILNLLLQSDRFLERILANKIFIFDKLEKYINNKNYMYFSKSIYYFTYANKEDIKTQLQNSTLNNIEKYITLLIKSIQTFKYSKEELKLIFKIITISRSNEEDKYNIIQISQNLVNNYDNDNKNYFCELFLKIIQEYPNNKILLKIFKNQFNGIIVNQRDNQSNSINQEYVNSLLKSVQTICENNSNDFQEILKHLYKLQLVIMLQHRSASDKVNYPLGKVNTPYFITNNAIENILTIFGTIINFIIKENLFKENFVLCENIFESFEYFLYILSIKVFVLNAFTQNNDLFYYNELLNHIFSESNKEQNNEYRQKHLISCIRIIFSYFRILIQKFKSSIVLNIEHNKILSLLKILLPSIQQKDNIVFSILIILNYILTYSNKNNNAFIDDKVDFCCGKIFLPFLENVLNIEKRYNIEVYNKLKELLDILSKRIPQRMKSDSFQYVESDYLNYFEFIIEQLLSIQKYNSELIDIYILLIKIHNCGEDYKYSVMKDNKKEMMGLLNILNVYYRCYYVSDIQLHKNENKINEFGILLFAKIKKYLESQTITFVYLEEKHDILCKIILEQIIQRKFNLIDFSKCSTLLIELIKLLIVDIEHLKQNKEIISESILDNVFWKFLFCSFTFHNVFRQLIKYLYTLPKNENIKTIIKLYYDFLTKLLYFVKQHKFNPQNYLLVYINENLFLLKNLILEFKDLPFDLAYFFVINIHLTDRLFPTNIQNINYIDILISHTKLIKPQLNNKLINDSFIFDKCVTKIDNPFELFESKINLIKQYCNTYTSDIYIINKNLCESLAYFTYEHILQNYDKLINDLIYLLKLDDKICIKYTKMCILLLLSKIVEHQEILKKLNHNNNLIEYVLSYLVTLPIENEHTTIKFNLLQYEVITKIIYLFCTKSNFIEQYQQTCNVHSVCKCLLNKSLLSKQSILNLQFILEQLFTYNNNEINDKIFNNDFTLLYKSLFDFNFSDIKIYIQILNLLIIIQTKYNSNSENMKCLLQSKFPIIINNIILHILQDNNYNEPKLKELIIDVIYNYIHNNKNNINFIEQCFFNSDNNSNNNNESYFIFDNFICLLKFHINVKKYISKGLTIIQSMIKYIKNNKQIKLSKIIRMLFKLLESANDKVLKTEIISLLKEIGLCERIYIIKLTEFIKQNKTEKDLIQNSFYVIKEILSSPKEHSPFSNKKFLTFCNQDLIPLIEKCFKLHISEYDIIDYITNIVELLHDEFTNINDKEKCFNLLFPTNIKNIKEEMFNNIINKCLASLNYIFINFKSTIKNSNKLHSNNQPTRNVKTTIEMADKLYTLLLEVCQCKNKIDQQILKNVLSIIKECPNNQIQSLIDEIFKNHSQLIQNNLIFDVINIIHLSLLEKYLTEFNLLHLTTLMRRLFYYANKSKDKESHFNSHLKALKQVSKITKYVFNNNNNNDNNDVSSEVIDNLITSKNNFIMFISTYEELSKQNEIESMFDNYTTIINNICINSPDTLNYLSQHNDKVKQFGKTTSNKNDNNNNIIIIIQQIDSSEKYHKHLIGIENMINDLIKNEKRILILDKTVKDNLLQQLSEQIKIYLYSEERASKKSCVIYFTLHDNNSECDFIIANEKQKLKCIPINCLRKITKSSDGIAFDHAFANFFKKPSNRKNCYIIKYIDETNNSIKDLSIEFVKANNTYIKNIEHLIYGMSSFPRNKFNNN